MKKLFVIASIAALPALATYAHCGKCAKHDAKKECPSKKECDKAKGECDKKKGDCDKKKGECPKKKGECKKKKDQPA